MKHSISPERLQDCADIAKAALYILGIIAAVYMLFKAVHEFMWMCHYAGIPM